MIILDTNVLSALAGPACDPAVAAWVGAQDEGNIYTTVVNEAEMLFEAALMPVGRRRAALELAIRTLFLNVMAGRVLPFDRAAAVAYASWAARRHAMGQKVGTADLQIAAIAVVRGARVLATRNVRDFAGCGVAVIDPWTAVP